MNLNSIQPPNSDKNLLQRYRRGDDDAATELYLRYSRRLKSLANAKTSEKLRQQIESEDVVQSIFRTFFRRVADGQYDVPEGDELWKLLLVIGLNKIRQLAIHHSAAKRDMHRTIKSDWSEEVDCSPAPTASDEGSMKVLELTIDELLSQMPVEFRQIVDYRIAGYEVAEIAEATGRAKRTVERILQTFRQKLSELIEHAEQN